jgi:hypothetical protein
MKILLAVQPPSRLLLMIECVNTVTLKAGKQIPKMKTPNLMMNFFVIRVVNLTAF